MHAPTIISIDSSAALALAENKQASTRVKHIDLKFHFVKDALEAGQVSLFDVPTTENPADMLIKIMDPETLKDLSRLIGLSHM